MEIECFKGSHRFWSFYIAIPSIIIWGLGIPFFAYILLRLDKDKLNREDVKEKYGFLYKGYKKEFYYWEIIIMYRKIVLVVIAVLIDKAGIIT